MNPPAELEFLRALAARLAGALASTRAIAALHMKARGFSEAQIAASFPETDEALAAVRAYLTEGP